MDQLDVNFKWVPGEEGRKARCVVCHRFDFAGIKPSDIPRHLNTRSHKNTVELQDALAQSGPALSDSDSDSDQHTDQADLIQQHEDNFSFTYCPSADDIPPDIPEDANDPLPDMTDFTRINSDLDSIDGDDSETFEPPDFDESLAEGDFHPFPSRLVFLLHLISSSPRCQMSVPQIKLVLQLLRWIGFKDTPSYYAYQKGVNAAIQAIGSGTERMEEVEGREGHHFVATSIAHELARDFSTPDIRQQLSLYPRRDKSINDLMDAEWVHSLRDQRSPPMAVLPSGRHAFVQEPVELSDYRVFLVSAWYQVEGKVHGWGRICEPSPDDTFFTVVSEREEPFPVSSIMSNGEEIKQRGYGTGE
ncbi:hypothetical protein CF319_g7403 [Tilletia indica]|nr:hypothetical protein CF319_g7403 [Tilletia indica]